MNPNAFDLLGFLIAYENGELDEEEIIAGFQYLVDSGFAWVLQGTYGRMAETLIGLGLVSAKKEGKI